MSTKHHESSRVTASSPTPMQYVVAKRTPHAEPRTFPIGADSHRAAIEAADAVMDTGPRLADAHTDRYWIETPRDILACALIRMSEISGDSSWLEELGRRTDRIDEIKKSRDPFVIAFFERVDFIGLQEPALGSALSYLSQNTIALVPLYQK